MVCQTLIALALPILANAPPCLLDSRTTLQRLADAGVETQGRAPLAGTGLCVALLPVHSPADVYAVSLPQDGVGLDEIRLLRKLPNIQQLRAPGGLTEEQHQIVRDAVPSGVFLLYDVFHPGRSVTKSKSIATEPADER